MSLNLQSRPRVLIVGGSFSGLSVARILCNRIFDIDVSVIEPREYFEYTPGIIHLLCGSKAVDTIFTGLSNVLGCGGIKHVMSRFVGIDSENNCVVLDNSTRLSFDAVAICTGTPYTLPIKSGLSSLDQRKVEIENYTQKLKNASDIVIIGGGVVGVEFAAEIACRMNERRNKTITLVSKGPLLGSLPAPAGAIALRWLRRSGVQVLLNDSILLPAVTRDVGNMESGGGRLVTVRGTDLGSPEQGVLLIDCTGGRRGGPVSSQLSWDTDSSVSQFAPVNVQSSDGLSTYANYDESTATLDVQAVLSSSKLLWPYSNQGLVHVDTHMKSTEFPNLPIFAAGDCAIETGGLIEGINDGATAVSPLHRFPYDMALTGSAQPKNVIIAEAQAQVCAANILSHLAVARASANYARPPASLQLQPLSLAKSEMLRFPRDVFGGSQHNMLLACVSLGPTYAIAIFNNIVFAGVFAALLKYVIEGAKVSQIRHGYIGRAFFFVVRSFTKILHRLMSWLHDRRHRLTVSKMEGIRPPVFS